MKKILLFSLIAGICITGISQNIPKIANPEMFKKAHKMSLKDLNYEPQSKNTTINFGLKEMAVSPNEVIIGTSLYDLQSNYTIGNRAYRHSDGTFGAVWTRGIEEAPGFLDRGTGYNYFNGTDWGPDPSARLESVRCGWPSYSGLSSNGEIAISHDFGAAEIYIMTREAKGTGDWNESVLESELTLSWPRMIAGGEDNNSVHIISKHKDESPIVYSRSQDGGVSWDITDVVLDEIGEDYYENIPADAYVWANPQGNTIAFLTSLAEYDLAVMKSVDNGDTWEKTVVWEHPYPMLVWGEIVTDTFYAPDGSANLALDSEGKVHVVFGIGRYLHDGEGGRWNFSTDGIGYWNEDMPLFNEDSDNMNALAPPDTGYESTEMIEDVNFIGWMQDVDGDGVVTLAADYSEYRTVGYSTLPAITVDDMGRRYLIYSSITETYAAGDFNFRHIWARAYDNGGWGPFADITGDISHWFDECMYPSFAGFSEDNVYYIYHADATPGIAVNDAHDWQENRTIFGTLTKSDMLTGISDFENISSERVSQNVPNPFSSQTTVTVDLANASDLNLDVTNMIGQKVMSISKGTVSSGTHEFLIDASNLNSGIYFYTVTSGNIAITKKMIVK